MKKPEDMPWVHALGGGKKRQCIQQLESREPRQGGCAFWRLGQGGCEQAGVRFGGWAKVGASRVLKSLELCHPACWERGLLRA